MATLILNAVGTAVGGPIGGAIGAVLGQSIDQRIFAPKPRHGPRLGDLAIQTSSYGAELPRLFGKMRVAGTVIWATDLVEQRSASGGGKGRPKTINYTYAANFAVALSARRLRAIHRIWADGKLLRGAGGDFKAATGFRFHDGDEDQDADPLIASAEGVGQAPAFRGVAYAVFEGLQLEDYGNRIPSLTFEVEADAAPVAIGAIAEELSAGAVAAGPTPTVCGYAASGDSVRSAVETLADIVPLTLPDEGDILLLRRTDTVPVLLPRAALCAPPELMRRAAGSVASEATLTHYEPARDYQSGVQRAVRGGTIQRSDRRSLAAAIDAKTAKAFAETRLATLWSGRSTARVKTGWRELGLRPGATLRVEGERGVWILRSLEVGPMILALDLERLPDRAAEPGGASPGRAVAEPDLIHGPTIFQLLDLPIPTDREGAWLFLLASGESPGWRRATITASFDGGASFADIGATAAPAVLGHAVTEIGSGSSALLDLRTSLEVELLHSGMWLEGRSDLALAGGANLAAVGSELVQFGTVEPLGGRRFRLGRLLRGRRGTEWAEHAAGEPFALVRADDLTSLAVPPGAIGIEAQVTLAGVGDGPSGVSATRLITAETLRPPSPVHLRAIADSSGAIAISWVRRSRAGWTWISGSDTALGEEQELYRVTIAAGALTRVAETTTPAFVYLAAAQAADGIAPPLLVEVVQLGTYAASRPARIAFG
jgi:hypothetical protein